MSGEIASRAIISQIKRQNDSKLPKTNNEICPLVANSRKVEIFV